MKTPVRISLLMATLISGIAPANAINLHFLQYDPAGQLEVDDWELESAAFLEAVEAPDGTTMSWNNPRTGRSGTVTPARRYTGSSGEPCRKIRETFKTKRGESQYQFPFCKGKDGNWRHPGAP
jgi:surface antigen